jgi:hypothetical protein
MLRPLRATSSRRHHEYGVAAVREAGIGAQENEKVGVTGHGDSHVSLCVIGTPGVVDFAATAALDGHGREHLTGLKAGGEYQCVRSPGVAVRRFDTVSGDA